MDNTIIGNTNLVQNDEQAIADYLKKRNLNKVNASSEIVHFKSTFYSKYVKRVLDIVISCIAFLSFLPFNFLLGICTYFDVGRPIFFKQTRVGKNLKTFTIVKFRNMNNNTDKDGKLLPARDRITKFGFFMRRFSLDELLNFWSVLKGDMSIIGPRPLPSFFYDRMSERHKMRCSVKPGLECPRVINVEGELYQKQFENDIWYVENVSFLTDFRMVFFLFKMTFSKKRGNAAAGGSYFVGYDDSCRAIYKELALEKYGDLMKEAS